MIKSSKRMGVNARKQAQMRQAQRLGVLRRGIGWMVRRGSVVLLLVGVVSGAVWYLGTQIARIDPQSWFALRQIQLKGADISEREQLLQAIAVELGTPLGQIPLDSIPLRLQTVPWVRTGKVHRRYPSTLVVEVEAAAPLALRELSGNWQLLLDNGALIDEPVGPAFPVPVVTGELSASVIAFLVALRTMDPALYGLLSQISASAESQGVECIFRHASHRVLFAASAADAQTFRHYRMLLRGASASLETIDIIDMRFRGFAYAIRVKKERQDG